MIRCSDEEEEGEDQEWSWRGRQGVEDWGWDRQTDLLGQESSVESDEVSTVAATSESVTPAGSDTSLDIDMDALRNCFFGRETDIVDRREGDRETTL